MDAGEGVGLIKMSKFDDNKSTKQKGNFLKTWKCYHYFTKE